MQDLSDREVKELLSEEYSEVDLNRGIHTVSILFSERALPRLIEIMRSSKISLQSRTKAALAIRDIGAETIADILFAIKNEGDSELKELVSLALSRINSKLKRKL